MCCSPSKVCDLEPIPICKRRSLGAVCGFCNDIFVYVGLILSIEDYMKRGCACDHLYVPLGQWPSKQEPMVGHDPQHMGCRMEPRSPGAITRLGLKQPRTGCCIRSAFTCRIQGSIAWPPAAFASFRTSADIMCCGAEVQVQG